MKRTLLLAAIVLCFFATVQAQTIEKIEKFNSQTRAYKEKMDSVVSQDYKRIMQYDERFNLTKETFYVFDGTWTISGIDEYSYDAQNRLISNTHYSFDGYTDERSNYQYNENGLLSEWASYIFEDGQWKNRTRQTFEYNSQGLRLSSLHYHGEENTWLPDMYLEYTYFNGLIEKTDLYYYWIDVETEEPQLELHERYRYTYNEKMLCTSFIDEYLYNTDEAYEWVPAQKEEYGYDEQDNRISYIYSNYDETLGYVFSYKTELVFDDHHNTINSNSYEYNESSWVLDGHGEFTYDLSAQAENIAGFDLYWEDDAIVVTNRLTSASWDYVSDAWSITYYYSKCTGVEEQNGHQVFCWPNPVQETLNIRMEDVQQIVIFDMEGRLILEVNNNVEAVNVSALPKGCYLLKATLENGGVSTQKFVKQ